VEGKCLSFFNECRLPWEIERKPEKLQNDRGLSRYSNRGGKSTYYTNTGDPCTGSLRAVVSQTHISHKRNVINSSFLRGNPFYVLKLLILTKKVKEN
jgi:hypothetical protein